MRGPRRYLRSQGRTDGERLMKIDNVSHLTTPTRIDQAKNKEKVGDVAPQANAESQSATHLSRASADASQDIDHARDRKSTRLNSSHPSISYAVFCLKKKNHHRL